MFKFDHTQALVDQEIGRSYESCVYPYLEGEDGSKWVVKCIKANNPQRTSDILQNILITSTAHSSSVVQVKGHDVQKDSQGETSIYIKMPRIQKSLDDLIRQSRESRENQLSLEQIIRYFGSITTCLEGLADKGVAHRNLKPTNILIDSEGSICLSDLRMIQLAEEAHQKDNREIVYKAPETYFDQQIDQEGSHKADVWSVGMVIAKLCLIDNIIPISRDLPTRDNKDIIEQNLEMIGREYGRRIADVLRRLLDINPNGRESLGFVRESLKKAFPEFLGQCSVDIKIYPLEESTLIKNDSQAVAEDEIGVLQSAAKSKLGCKKESIMQFLKTYKCCILVLLPSIFIIIIVLAVVLSIRARNIEHQEKFSNIMRSFQQKYQDFYHISFDQMGTIDVQPFWGSGFGPLFFDNEKLTTFMNDLIIPLENKQLLDYPQEFSFSFLYPSHIFGPGIQDFANSIVKLQGLKKLSLDKIAGDYIENKDLHSLIQIISSGCKNLQSFGLVLANPLPVENSDVNAMVVNILQNSKGLNAFHLTLDYLNEKLSGALLTDLKSNLNDLGKNLKTLSLKFPGMLAFASFEWIDFNSQLLSGLEQLSELNLAYNSTYIDNEGLIALGIRIAAHKKLETLTLTIDKCPFIDDLGITNFGNKLRWNKQLQHVYINVSPEYISNDAKVQLRLDLAYVTDLHINPE